LGIFLKILNYNSEFFYLNSIPVYTGIKKRIVNLRRKGPKTPPASDFTDYQKEVIFGSMLGDLTAERTHFKGNTRLRFYMSLKNEKLIYHLYSIFKQYVKTEPKIYNRKLNNLTKGLHKDIGPPPVREYFKIYLF